MSELPERPNLDQLRRQARELLRDADSGESEALHRLRVVSDHVTLSAAQLAIAREHGFSSWPALHAEVERRRSATPVTTAGLADLSSAKPSPLTPMRRSFGGIATIDADAGTLSFSALITGPGRAFIDASLAPSAQTERQLAGPPAGRIRGLRFINGLLGRSRPHVPGLGFGDVIVSDDHGAGYVLRAEEWVVHRAALGRFSGPIWLRLGLDPVPPPGCRWIDVRGPGGTVARLLPSARPEVRVSDLVRAEGNEAERELARLAISLIRIRLAVEDDPDTASGSEAVLAQECSAVLSRLAQLRDAGELTSAGSLPGQVTQLTEALTGRRPGGELPTSWASILGAASATNGPLLQLDLEAYVPAADGIGVQLDTLVSEPARWQVYLRAAPGWWAGNEDKRQRRESLKVTAEDNLGGMYVSSFAGGTGQGDHEELALTFRPRLNPRARTVALTFTGHRELTTALVTVASASATDHR